MSSSTGTPSALNGHASGHNSSVEPSPASTYGGSASSDAGDDVPQTPGDEGVLLNKLAKLNINNRKSAERYSPPFVRNGAQSHDDDPFTSPSSQRHSGQRTPVAPNVKTRSAKSGNWRSGPSSGSGSGSSSTSAAKVLRSDEGGRGVFVREYSSEDGEFSTNEAIIKPEDAQAIFPPSSCVFVANLLQSEGDEALEVAVTQVFREFGTVYVKIRRDAKHMPFAFCQYTNDDDAEHAIKNGRGRLIKGRPCRCEKAKAHRLFFFERKYGSPVTPSEVEQLLRGFGRINFCRPVNHIERAAYNLSEGVMVQFEMYDEGQAALQSYRNNTEYKMQCMANMASPARDQSRSDPALRAYLETYAVDKRSVFVGNLPSDVTEAQLKEIFEQFGSVVQITLHKNESTVDANQKHCFAFVEFQLQPSVSRALAELSGFVLGGRVIRVSQKDTEAAKLRNRRQQARSTASTPGSSHQSRAPRSTGQQQVSPMSHMSPAVYSSPFAYGSQYYNMPGAIYSTGQYYASPGYSPYSSPYASYAPFYSYTGGSPSYGTGATSTAAAGNPNYFYGAAPQFPASPATYWGVSGSSPMAQQTYYPPAYSSPMATNSTQDDRSSTPTPGGFTSTTESSMESE